MKKLQSGSPIAPVTIGDGKLSFATQPIVLTREHLMTFSTREPLDKPIGATIELGWTPDALLIHAKILDWDVENSQPLEDIWRQDCLELFLEPDDDNGSFAFGKNYHITISAPDEMNRCRTAILSGNIQQHAAATGHRTADGYELTVEIKLAAFEPYDLTNGYPFLMKILIDDWDHADGSPMNNPQPRILSLRKGQLQENKPLHVHLASAEESGSLADLDAWWTVPQLPLMFGGRLAFTLQCPLEHDALEVQLADREGHILATCTLQNPDHSIRFDGIQQDGKLQLSVFPTLAGKRLGFLKLPVFHLKAIPAKLADLDWGKLSAENPVKAAGCLALLAAFESLKFAVVRERPNINDIASELECRLALLEDRDIPSNIPEKYSLLKLMQGWNAQIAVEYDHSMRHFGAEQVFVGIPWGNIPLVQASILFFPNEKEASDYLKWRMSFTVHTTPPNLEHCDEVMTGVGHLLGDGMPWDRDFSRQVELLSPLRPRTRILLPFQEAQKLNICSYTRFPDAPDDAPALEVNSNDTLALSAFSGANGQEPPSLFFSENGIETDILMARQKTMVIQTAWTIPELDATFTQMLLDRTPLSQKTARHFRDLLAAKLNVQSAQTATQPFLVGDLHTHSLYSDGWISPGGMLANSIPAGLDFLIFTDHNRMDTRYFMDELAERSHCRLAYGVGLEISNSWRYHLNVFPAMKPMDMECPYSHILRQCREMDACLQLNHPLLYGDALKDYWYGDISLSGLSAVERNLSQRDAWLKQGAHIPIVGSTDTHTACFFQREKTLVPLATFSEKDLADAIRQNEVAMIAPYLRDFIFGEQDLLQRILPSLLPLDAPAQFGRRLAKMLAAFDAQAFIENSAPASDLPPWYSLIRRQFLVPEKLER